MMEEQKELMDKIRGELKTPFYTISWDEADESWDEADENWRIKNVYYILLDEPSRPYSLEQFSEWHPEIKEESIMEVYEKTVPVVAVLTIPECWIMGGA
jgi:hypothetical protein